MTWTSLPSVIFLNGASSAGKTTVGRALQDSLGEPYLLMGLDTCFAMVPAQWSGGPMGADREQGFQYVDLPDEDGKPVCGISYGAVGLRMLKGFHRAVREFVQAGNPVIVDEMMLGPEVRDHWFTTLAGLDVVWVGVRCDLDELERREVERRGRVGLARWSEKSVHEGMAYDLWVETASRDAEACADQIVAAAHGRSELDSNPAESTDRENSAGSLSDPVRGVRSRDEWRPEEGRRDEE